MPQQESMGMYANETIPIPPTGNEEAWAKMPHLFNEHNYGRIRCHWRFENYTMHQSMMKNYYRMATEVDTAIGAMVNELKRQNEYEKTIIIFTSDNGNFHSEHGLADKW
jgi:arylsulfatase A-like enzyme